MHKRQYRNIRITTNSCYFFRSSSYYYISLSWDEWGRKARDCKGAGLCNFRLEEVEIRIPIRSFSANVEKRDDRLLVDIAANEDLIFEDDSRKLYIDEDIYTTSHDDRTFRLPAGEYEFIESIGESGGYRLELFEL